MGNRTAGADNLLTNCAGLLPGQSLLVVAEERGAGHYDDQIGQTVAQSARDRGIRAELVRIAANETAPGLDASLARRMAKADCTIFFARLGDQIRFRELPTGTAAVVSYILDHDALGSRFATAHHQAFLALKAALDRMMQNARDIRVTCARGTDFSGPGSGADDKIDVSISRFPMSVFAPVSARDFSGRVALAGFLAGTGSRFYQPYGRTFHGPVLAHFAKGRLTGFTGAPTDVALAEAHYDDVARRFDLDRDAVHSWHAGIHPGCAYHAPAERDFGRWGSAAFGNPRLLHFHTCGGLPPGEISWNVLDPTISIDGQVIWNAGRLLPQRVPGGAEILAQFPCAADVFARPERDVGVTCALPGLAQV